MLLDIFDPKAPPKPVGIDLGTTNSIVASVRDGRPGALTTCDGTALLPSVVYYGDHGAVIVGLVVAAIAGALLTYGLTRQPTRSSSTSRTWIPTGSRWR